MLKLRPSLSRVANGSAPAGSLSGRFAAVFETGETLPAFAYMAEVSQFEPTKPFRYYEVNLLSER
jgi:hypothetical protein